mmetsp:Transcript_32363/g.92862  ORF Transcript_32363/g.92862 Transcript_32363/m.92862 type:complete len:235 (-) Transcript_32363:210-914(-)|eukprot:CAMPEP_0168420786 /NCGR_PEP_ID=MMETSP0228-20121227/32949_1 /TAXON_ID=133427 /ORGANISM="Protoceratium reticulatum, Strain CCCM 535 (=CCMP 1889)" /LENGTH=234 /DNA_ID=CAMNT_0008434681 /DNA_START=38 /DNA_END=742 /DNA_ORIENTATION=-
MNPYGAYANPYGAYANPYADASGGGGYAGMSYPTGAGQGWWGMSGYDGGVPADGGEWPSSWGGKDNGKGAPAGKGGVKSDGKGSAVRKPVMCKFFLEGRCTRGSSCAFSHGDPGASVEEEESDPEMREIEAALAQAQGDKDADTAIMESLRKAEEEEATADQAAQQRERGSSSGGSDSGDALPPPATEAEIEEARQIVQRAQREATERAKMKAKAKAASRDDLQAMINARLALK